MSLAPAERRVLAMIEASLDRSDPRLASMLTRFTLPASWGGVMVLARRLRPLGRRIMSAVAVIVAFMIIFVVLHTPATPLRCAAPNGTAATQATNCPPSWPAGYAGSTAGDRAAEPAGNQITP